MGTSLNTEDTTTAPKMDTTTTTATTSSPSSSTLYPKILGDIRTIICSLEKHYEPTDISTIRPIRMTGTVKLHGTHADIRIHPRTGRLVPQSRNNAALTPARDNFDFAAFCATQRARILLLGDAVRRRRDELLHAANNDNNNTSTPALPPQPRPTDCDDEDEEEEEVLILAGEWIGNKIQSRPFTAIRDLSRRFVLCGIRIGGAWEPIERYADVADEEAGLYNVARGGFWHLELDVADGGKAFMEEARRLAEEVHERCPFGAALGVEGPGEGIVWTPAAVESGGGGDGGGDVPNDPAFWIKTKGEGFEEGPRRDPNASQPPPRDQGKDEEAKEFAGRACHERRLEQGWDYLREMHIERSMRGMQTFLNWVVGDVEVEEKEDIADLKLGKRWKMWVSRTARDWYLRQLETGGVVSPSC